MNEKINLQDLVALLADKANITKKDAETLVKECFDTMEEGLVKDKLLKIRNLGTFKLIRVEDRESVDVSTGERVIIPAHYKVTFSPDTELAEKVNAPYASLKNTEIEENEPAEKLEDTVEEETEEENEEEGNGEETKIEETVAEVENKREEVISSPERLENIQKETENEKELEDEQKNPIDSEEYYDEDSEPVKSKAGLFWLFFTIASLLILFFAGRYFCPMIFGDAVNCKGNASIAPTATVSSDSILTGNARIARTQPDTSVRALHVTPQPNKTHKILEGERLNTIALREYGHKAFWVYIYEENRNRIDNPDLINPGMVINIPPAKKYGIDKNNPESVKKALELEQKYKP